MAESIRHHSIACPDEHPIIKQAHMVLNAPPHYRAGFAVATIRRALTYFDLLGPSAHNALRLLLSDPDSVRHQGELVTIIEVAIDRKLQGLIP